jgi:hypothetical protein
VSGPSLASIHGAGSIADRALAVQSRNEAVHELLAAEPRVRATTIQTVGAKGWDGFTLALIEA